MVKKHQNMSFRPNDTIWPNKKVNVKFLILLDYEVPSSNMKDDWSQDLCGAYISPVSFPHLKWIGVDYRTHKRKEAGGLFTCRSYSALEQLLNLNKRGEIVVCASVVLNNCSEIHSLIMNEFYVVHLYWFWSLNWNEQEARRLSILEYPFSLPLAPQNQ